MSPAAYRCGRFLVMNVSVFRFLANGKACCLACAFMPPKGGAFEAQDLPTVTTGTVGCIR
jgi:hypothetical protein